MSQARQNKCLPAVVLDVEVMRAFATTRYTPSIQTFHPCREVAAGPRCLNRKLDPSPLHDFALLPASDITSQSLWCMPWLPSPHRDLHNSPRISPPATFCLRPHLSSMTSSFWHLFFWRAKIHLPPSLNSFCA